MVPFIAEDIRRKISGILTRLTGEMPGKQKITIHDIDILMDHVSQKYNDAVNTMSDEAKDELSTAYFGSLVIALTALKVADIQNPRPIDPQWLYPESKVDPNLVLEGLLVNIANQCISIINLATSGFAYSARILLRSTIELTWLTLVLTTQREKMLVYCQETSDKAEREIFRKHFTERKLQESLGRIEERLFLSDDMSKLLSGARLEAYTFFSKHIHNSFVATVLGTRAPAIKEPNNMEYALFSTASVPARGVVTSLNFQVLLYLIATLLPALKVFHSFDSVKLWDDNLSLRECFITLYFQQV